MGPAFAGSFLTSRTTELLCCVHRHSLFYSFYGINLNQNVVLQQIGFDGGSGSAWERLFKVSTGGIIITVLGFVPGEGDALLERNVVS